MAERETLTSAGAVVDRLTDLVATAGDELAVSVPAGTLETVREPLERAVDDGVLVLLLASGGDAVDADAFDGAATVARRWEGHAPLSCVADGERGLRAPAPFVAGERTDRPATAFDDPALAGALLDGFVGSYWLSGREVHAAAPAPLGRPYTSFRRAVVQGTLRLRERERVRAQVVGRPTPGADTETVEGPLVDARQSLVAPATTPSPGLPSLAVRTDDGVVTVGGWGAVAPDYEAELVTLNPPD